ncbi:hypothetical protein [Cutibacterium avidum]|uniref:hypothetical protein n=1 Tax=Cutibacterium avidum TaxID=33010 RepID=UPI0002CCE043|nr:hypothetical protein [Cutibacterium avidum]ERS37323.1 hypothetical protein HMPREF1271_01864 [Propionibacterium sp. KPL1838]ERS66185.1 hypothetical protein HMPREF1279_01530 [Propionibacterium sp. KPL1852]AGJ77981.1 hypothetical protein PALO_06865 [Cutibacterium avidum 44067]ERF55498.1 hypothetical protein H639_11349 [Cutibacterium avidum TM16]MCO6633200.1 hypothetical protein [Cutibacterium avidum]
MRVSFPWESDVWAPTLKVAQKAEKAQLMTVRIQVSPAAALDEAWAELSRDHASEGEYLLDGGASLLRCGDGLVEACSGGEDVLSSLSWVVNQTLESAVRHADADATLTVVEEAPGRRQMEL